MFIHDYIKITYTTLGYLPNFPHYLISDQEMIEAFLKEDGYFDSMYYCPCDELEIPYLTLKNAIREKLENYLSDPDNSIIPDWVYSYMVMQTVTYSSPEEDIADLYKLEGISSPLALAEFTPELAFACYSTSKDWIKKRPTQYKDRPPTMFGEPHVIKSLRIKQANILLGPEE